MKAHLSLVLLLACGHSHAPTFATPDSSSADQERWSADNEDPATLVPNASTKLKDVILASDVGQTFGVDDNNIPYPDTYWPFTNGGIAAQWNGPQSPLAKYMDLVNPAGTSDAVKWEMINHGPQAPGVQDWWGHCPGWTGAAMTNAPILQGVNALKVEGGLAKCDLSQEGCVHFEIGDVNALAAEVYVDASLSFLGSRCDTSPTQIQRDSDGRIQGGCKGLNPGSLMVILADRMKHQHLALAIDAQQPSTTDQIWNQPAFRYQVYRYQTLSKAQAAQKVSGDTHATDYKWNSAAQGWVFVDVGIKWVAENGPNRSVVSGLLTQRETRFTAVLELDHSPSNAAARVIGGEYIDDPSVGSNRLKVAPFVWTSGDKGLDNLPLTVDGDSHNPYVDFTFVKELISLTR